MSTITEVINRIAIVAEQSGYLSCLESWSVCGGYSPDYPPRLSIEQIQELTQNYPFYLPLELCELYQRGNGCLPISINPHKNWDSFNSYFQFEFPCSDSCFFTLEEAMSNYHSLAPWLSKYEPKVQLSRRLNKSQEQFVAHFLNKKNFASRIIPISSTENGLYFLIGHEEQQETSPILFLWDDFVISVKCSSLTCMMLAMAEVLEREMQEPKPNQYEIEAIWHKYMEEVE